MILTIYPIVIVALFLGLLIARFSKSELKNGEKWFYLLQVLILLFVVVFTIGLNFNLAGLLIGIVFGLIFRKEYFYLGIGIITTSNGLQTFYIFSSLTFLYSLIYGTIIYFKKEFNKLILDISLFLMPIVLYVLDVELVSFCVGALISILIFKSKESINLFKIYFWK